MNNIDRLWVNFLWENTWECLEEILELFYECVLSNFGDIFDW